MKRDVLEGEKAIAAKKIVARAGNRALRSKKESPEKGDEAMVGEK